MTDDFSTELEEIAKLVSAYPRGLAELRELIASLPAPSPLALPGTSETKLPTTDEQTNELSSGPVSAAGVAGSTNSAPASISGGSIIPGTLQAAAFASSIRPIQMIDGPDLPTLPDANFPDGAVIFNLDDGRNYRNDADVWRTLSPERGLGNMLMDPTFMSVDDAVRFFDAVEQKLGAWLVRYELITGTERDDPYLWLVYERDNAWNPYSSAMLSWTCPTNTTAQDAYAYFYPGDHVKGSILDLPYVVASIQLMDWGYYSGTEADWTEIEFGVEIWKDGTPDVKLAETYVDLKTIPPDFPVQVWISYQRPDPANDNTTYYVRYVWHTTKVDTDPRRPAWEIGLGEPMMHFASTPDPAEFTPAVAKWIPASFEAWDNFENQPVLHIDKSGMAFTMPDATSVDTMFQHIATNVLRISGHSANPTELQILGYLTNPAAIGLYRNGEYYNQVVKLTTGTGPNPALELGPGGSARDLRLRRSAAKTLEVDDNAGGAATLNVVGTLLVNGSPVGGGDEALAYIYF